MTAPTRPIRRPFAAPGRRRSPVRRAFTIAEVLISLTILALLISSMAVAFQASLRNCEENERLAAATQTARSLMNRITAHVRAAQAVELWGPSDELVILCPEDGSGDERQVRYYGDYDSHTLRRELKVNGVATEDVPLLGDTEDFEFSSFHAEIQVGQDSQGQDCAKSVTVWLSFQQDGRTISLTNSASPRRNQTY